MRVGIQPGLQRQIVVGDPVIVVYLPYAIARLRVQLAEFAKRDYPGAAGAFRKALEFLLGALVELTPLLVGLC
jgi:hypothetical protein